jgi:hypothetical protein
MPRSALPRLLERWPQRLQIRASDVAEESHSPWYPLYNRRMNFTPKIVVMDGTGASEGHRVYYGVMPDDQLAQLGFEDAMAEEEARHASRARLRKGHNVRLPEQLTISIEKRGITGNVASA